MSKQEKDFSRRQMLEMTMGLSGLALTGGVGSIFAHETRTMPTRIVTVDAKPEPIAIDIAKTAVIVVDMQNDFGSEGGMFQRRGSNISMIQAAVADIKSLDFSPQRRHQNHLFENGVQARSFGCRFF